MKRLLLIGLGLTVVAFGCNDECSLGDGDALGSYAFFVAFEAEDGQDLFESETYFIDSLTITTTHDQPIGLDDLFIVFNNERTLIGIDRFNIINTSQVDISFNFGNGDADILSIENGPTLRSFGENKNCAEGVVTFHYENNEIGRWDFDANPDLAWDLHERNGIEASVPTDPLFFTIQKIAN